MIIIDMTQFRAGRTDREAREAVRHLFMPFAQPAADEPHIHPYSIVLVENDGGHGVELSTFEAPCPNGNDAGHVRVLVDTLRELADEIRDAHADLLAEDTTDISPSDLVDMLSLVEVNVTPAEVEAWTQEQRCQALVWASATHMRASDNDVHVPDQPDFVAVGDFRVGDIVRSKNSVQTVMVTGGGVWLKSFYELVSPRKYATPGPGATATDETNED